MKLSRPLLPATLCALLLLANSAAAADKLGERLRQALRPLRADDPVVVWVYLRDKGPDALHKAAPRDLVSERCIQRRLKVCPPSQVVGEMDLPLAETYVDAIAGRVQQVRQRSRWFNSLSVAATKRLVLALQALPIVDHIELVARFRRQPEPPAGIAAPEPSAASTPPRPTSLNYGPSLGQLQQINVTGLHDLGLSGQNIIIGHFDNGLRLMSHEAFASLHIVAQHDFVDHDGDPAPPPGSPDNVGAHGISTLSVLGGFKSGELLGAAYGADFVLARTENDFSETPIEEDNWVAAIEWAESLGVDVTSTSLGYLDYEPPYTSWSWEDMDGNTTVITRAADLAAARGVVVVNSAGNDGLDLTHNTLSAPADGDSVIAVGAVTASGSRAAFSSVGPTTSIPPRIKPDVMAQGSGVWVAKATGTTDYGFGGGTSFSCPLAAGVAALLLSGCPGARPMQIRDAMRLTASQASSPDNLLGWGILNASAALDYLKASDSASATPPPAFRLEPNYPNPFNPSTVIRYLLPAPAFVTLRVYDLSGRAVRLLVNRDEPAAPHAVVWDASDDAGRRLPSGVYLYRLHAASGAGDAARVFEAARKMTLVR